MTPASTPRFSLVGASSPCVGCRYDLVGLPILGNCPECGAAISKSVPPCPRCRESGIARPLSLHTAENRRVWRCDGCRGLGFERGQLAARIRGGGAPEPADRSPPPDLTAQTSVGCGACGIRMVCMMVDGRVMIDRCDRCGFVWLDAGEFAAVAAFVAETAGAQKMPDDAEHLLGDRDALQRRLESNPIDSTAAWTIAAILEGLLWFS